MLDLKSILWSLHTIHTEVQDRSPSGAWNDVGAAVRDEVGRLSEVLVPTRTEVLKSSG